MIAFIDAHRSAYGVEPICRVLPVAPRSHHAQVAQRRAPERASARTRRDNLLKTEIRRVHAEHFGVYGVRKVWHQLRREGLAVARCTLARLMRVLSLRGVVRGKETRTTMPDKGAPCPADRVNRQFHAPRPHLLWLSDFTCIANWQGRIGPCGRRGAPCCTRKATRRPYPMWKRSRRSASRA